MFRKPPEITGVGWRSLTPQANESNIDPRKGTKLALSNPDRLTDRNIANLRHLKNAKNHRIDFGDWARKKITTSADIIILDKNRLEIAGQNIEFNSASMLNEINEGG